MKIIITIAVMLIMNFCCFAQTDPVRTQLNSIFQNIDKSQIPTGYLNEYGPEVVNKRLLNGILSDSNLVTDMNTFSFLYNDIENCKINNTTSSISRVIQQTLLPLDSAKVWIDIARYDTTSNLVLFSANYASLREDAIQQNLFTKVRNQIFDVVGRTQSPYLLNHTFAAVTVLPESKFINQIKLNYGGLFYTNTNNTITTVLVNFLDGAGYQNLYNNNAGTVLSKTYSDSSGFKKYAIKVIYSNGTIDECYTGQYVNVTSTVSNNMANRYDLLQPQEIQTPAFSVIPSSYQNINPTIPNFYLNNFPYLPITQNMLQKQRFNQNMKLYIRYSKKRIGTALENKIVKPFIVVEGYDITDASPLLKANNYSINSLIREWDNDEFLNTYDFNKKLDKDAGYDLIFIDYYTMRSLTENADYLLQAIDWINSQKVNNAAGLREQNIVMGISMGGLVTRYALAKRTKLTNSNSTATKSLFTMDSPHQGANVPLGLQHFLYDFGEAKIVKKIADVSDELKAFYYLNNLPATQEQLILRVTDGNGNRANNTFLADGGTYRTMVDYASPYPFYAISNGSQCATSLMQPSTLLLSKDGNVGIANWLLFTFMNKYRLNIQVNSLPSYGVQQQICSVVMERNIRLFWGLIGTGWTTTSNTAPRISPPNTIPWDGVPGGTKSTETTGPISQSGTTPYVQIKDVSFLKNVWRSIVFLLFNNTSTNIQLPFSQKEFTFIPITSALDVQNITANTFNQPFNFAINGLNGSRANKFIAQDFNARNLFNITHTDFTPRNSRWIYNEMQNVTQPVDCVDYCLGDIKITPDEGICGSTNTYSIANLPTGANVIWSVNPSGIVSNTALSTNPITLSKITEGSVTLSANVTLPCSNTPGGTASNLFFTKILPVANVGFTGTYTASVDATSTPLVSGNTRYIQVQRGQYVSVLFNIVSSQNLTNLRWSSDGYSINGYGNNYSFSLNAAQTGYTSSYRSIYLYANSPCGSVSYFFSFNIMSLGWRMVVAASPNPISSGEINIAVTKEYDNTVPPANFPAEPKIINPYTKITITPLNSNIVAKTLLFLEDTNVNYKINSSGLTIGTYAITIERNNIITTAKIIVL